MSGKTSLPVPLPRQETQSNRCLCAGVRSNPQHHPPAKERPAASQSQHSQPAETLAVLPRQQQPGQGVRMGWSTELGPRARQSR